MRLRIVRIGFLTAFCVGAVMAIPRAAADGTAPAFAHVLLISIDGLHASDLDRFVAGYPDTTLAKLRDRRAHV